MSFGFSVDDFLVTALLIKDIICCLQANGGAASEYQELVRELHDLQQALNAIERLQGNPNQASTVDGLKIAGLNCQSVLDNFRAKLKKFEAGLEAGCSRGKLRDGAAKIKWQLTMQKDVEDLRAYLSVHSSSMNMMLSIAGLLVKPWPPKIACPGGHLLLKL